MCRSLTEISGSHKITGSQVTERPGSPKELRDTSKSIKISQIDPEFFMDSGLLKKFLDLQKHPVRVACKISKKFLNLPKSKYPRSPKKFRSCLS